MRFYIYELRDPRNEIPFYVGKGSGNRIDNHERGARAGKDNACCRRIRDIWNCGMQVNKVIIFETDIESQAYSKEKERIAELGLKNLTNVVRGGGATLPSEMLKLIGRKISLALTGKIQSEEVRRKNSEWHKGKKKSEETKRKMGDAQRGKHVTEETRSKQSKSHKGLQTWNKGMTTPLEVRVKQSESGRNRFSSEEERRKQADRIRGKHASEETLKKMRESQKKRRQLESALR